MLGTGLTVPPVNVGVRSTPNYAKTFTGAATHLLRGGRMVFAGQRADAFNVDLGSIFDLGTLRPFEMAHLIPSAAAAGVNGVQGLNVHTIAIQVPITDLTRGHTARPRWTIRWPPSASGPARAGAGSGCSTPTAASARTPAAGGRSAGSRMPLFNEVINPMSVKDRWNASSPYDEQTFATYVAKPELAGLLPVLYPGVFPNLAKYTKDRADLSAILLTGIPSGVVPGFQNYTGGLQADLVRLNVAVPPASKPNPLGLVAGDAGRLPERSPGVRRRGHRRAPRDRRADHPVGGQVLHPGRRGVGGQGRDDEHQQPVAVQLPLPGDAWRRLPVHAGQGRGVMTVADAKENPYAGQGPVLLDIGGDVGALVVTMPARLDGVEVEIRAVGDEAGADDHGAGPA